MFPYSILSILQDKQKNTYIKTLKSIILYNSDHGLQFKKTKLPSIKDFAKMYWLENFKL